MPPKKTPAAGAAAAKKKTAALTKSQVAGSLADATELTKRQVVDLFEKLQEFIAAELHAGRAVNLMGLLTVRLVNKAATPAGLRNIGGRELMVAAKPACKKVRVSMKKALKDLA